MSEAGECSSVVILDRDGTVVIDRGYLDDPAGLEFEPQAAAALRWLHARGHRLVVITNQSGVGRGFFSLECLEAMNRRLYAMVEEAGARLEGIYFCPHSPEANCACRKPAVGLLLQAASELRFDPRLAVVIGDKESDVEFGRRAGAATILISGHAIASDATIRPDRVARDLMEAARAVDTLLRARDRASAVTQ